MVLSAIPAVMACLPLNAESTVVNGGPDVTRHVSMVDTGGVMAIVPFLIPVLVLAIPVALNGRRAAQPVRVVITVLLGLGVIVAVASVGWFYMPAWLASAMATRAGADQRPPLRRERSPVV